MNRIIMTKLMEQNKYASFRPQQGLTIMNIKKGSEWKKVG